MAELGARERARLPDAAFAYIDSDGRRRLPIHDEAHVRNALARFDRILFEDDSARDRARTKLLKAAKRHGIVPVGFIDGQLRPHRRLPSGTLTLLFADIEGSSRLLEQLGDGYGPMLSQVQRILRTTARRASGHEVDARADEFFAAFERATDALEAAVGVQLAMAAAAWPDERDVRVRIGLHTGRPTLQAAGYVGLAVNVGARICGAGHGGQILVSSAARMAIGEGSAYELRALGTHRLRGIGDGHDLFQVVAPDLLDGFPPLRIGV